MATASAVSANKAELIAIADAVAREKLIDRMIVIEAMEDAIQRAARARYGAENDIRAKLDPTSGDLRLWRVVEVVEEVEDYFKQVEPRGFPEAAARRPARRLHRRSAAADRVRPHRRPGRQAGHLPEGPRCRARASVRGVQGPHRRDHHRRRQAGRVRPRRRRPRPRRGRHPPRPADPARGAPRRRPHPQPDLERPPRKSRSADLPVTARIPIS